MCRGDQRGGGYFSITPVDSLLASFSPAQQQTLRQLHLDCSIPPEFDSHKPSEYNSPALPLPLFFGEGRMRYRADMMSGTADVALLASLQQAIAMAMEKAVPMPLPARCMLLLDNQRFLHARSTVKDPQRHLLRIRFDWPEQRHPRLDLALLASPQASLELVHHPIQTTWKGLPCDQARTSPHAMYWSPSGQSGANAGAQSLFSGLTATTSTGNHIMRRQLAQAIRAQGVLDEDVRCVNLFTFGMVYRSGEIIHEILEHCGATSLPLGSQARDEEAIQLLQQHEAFGINAVGGFSTKLISVAHCLEKDQIQLLHVKRVIYAGEPLPPSSRAQMARVFHPHVQFLGLYGSSECGVFAFQSEHTWRWAGLDQPSPTVYQSIDDAVHVEVVEPDATGAGDLIVTNYIREPHMIRFNTGDRGRLVRRHASGQCFEVLGRQSGSQGFNHLSFVHWLSYEELQEKVLAPLQLMEVPNQMWFEWNEKGEQVVRLVLLDGPYLHDDRGLGLLEESFSSYMQDLLEPDHVCHMLVTPLPHLEAMHRSLRSQKLLKFVDKRL